MNNETENKDANDKYDISKVMIRIFLGMAGMIMAGRLIENNSSCGSDRDDNASANISGCTTLGKRRGRRSRFPKTLGKGRERERARARRRPGRAVSSDPTLSSPSAVREEGRRRTSPLHAVVAVVASDGSERYRGNRDCVVLRNALLSLALCL